MNTLSDPTLSDPTTTETSDGADAAAAAGVQTFTDGEGNEWDSLGNLVQSGSAIGPDGSGGTTAVADSSQHHDSLSEQYAKHQAQDGYASAGAATNDEQRRNLEMLRAVE